MAILIKKTQMAAPHLDMPKSEFCCEFIRPNKINVFFQGNMAYIETVLSETALELIKKSQPVATPYKKERKGKRKRNSTTSSLKSCIKEVNKRRPRISHMLAPDVVLELSE